MNQQEVLEIFVALGVFGMLLVLFGIVIGIIIAVI